MIDFFFGKLKVIDENGLVKCVLVPTYPMTEFRTLSMTEQLDNTAG